MDRLKADRDHDVTTGVHEPHLDGSHPIQYPESAVAIVGVACRFAGANSLEHLWQILETGESQCVDIPKGRFPESRLYRRPFRRNFQASVIDDIDAFDHKFFGVPNREANFRDPQQRLALEVTYQALESAGYFSREITEEQRDMGCYIATAMNEYRENVTTHTPSAFSLTGSIRPFIAGQVSHHFGFTGPSIMLDAACAASGVAVNTACRAVAGGECKSAIVGATNLFISPDTFQDLACGHFISPTGPSKPFDAAADGYGRGEGVAAIVLKRLSDALEDGDVIRGVISATAVNQCANECPITVPHAPTQSSLYRKALRLAQLDASQISYVEAHGTGTRVGDPIEIESIRAVFGNLDRKPGAKTFMGSLKSNIGHTEASAGLSGLIKVMLMIEKGIIPQQALFNKLHPEIHPLGPSGLEIPTKNLPWTSEYRAGCVNNYGASGCNAVMILTQAPTPAEAKPTSQVSTFPVSIRAFSQTSLNSYCSALLDFIESSDASDNLALDICFQLSRRRNPELSLSANASISDVRELKNFLRSTMAETAQKSENTKPPTVLFFGGQDGKTTSVSRELYDSCVVFRKHLDACEASLQALGCPSIFPTIFELDVSDKGSMLAHSKLFSVQYASAKAWIDCGLQPSRLIGHSFCQITALCVCGSLSLQDALCLVTSRARLIDEIWGSDTGSMIAIEATEDELSELLQQHSDLALETACYNGARSFVVAGTTSSVDLMEASLSGSPKSYRFKRLQVPNAFHSALAEPLIEPLLKVAEQLKLQEPEILLETCSKGCTWSSIEPLLVASQIREPVYFHQAVQRIADRLGPSVWIEAGWGGNASLLRRALEPQASGHMIRSVKADSSSSLKYLAETTAELWRTNLKIQFWPFHQDQRHQYRILNLPPYQFDKTRHWIEWQEPSLQTGFEAPLIAESEPFIRLVRETEDGGEFEVNTQFESWQASCFENRILGVPSCPIYLLLDLLSEALGTFHGASGQKVCISRIQHLHMPVPISAKLDNRLYMKISKTDSSDLWSFRLTKASDTNHELASGTVYTGKANPQSDFVRFERLIDIARVEEIQNNAGSDSIRGRGVYRLLAELFQVAKSNQVIRDVSARGDEACASLVSLSESSPLALETLIQIPLICLNSLHECPDGYVFINTAIGEAHFKEISASSGETHASHSVYVKFFGLGGPEPTCDMYVFDAKGGRIHSIALDVAFARIPVESLRQALDNNAVSLPRQAISHEVHSSEILAPDRGKLSTDQYPEQCPSEDECLQSDGLPDLTSALFDLLVRITDVDAGKVHEGTLIADLGVDSLMWMEVADEINRFFAIDIDLAEFIVVDDMRALCQLVADRATGFSYSSGISPGSVSSTVSHMGATVSSSNTEISNYGESPGAVRGSPLSRSSNFASMNSTLKAFDKIRAEFDALARETGCNAFWSEIHPVQTRLIEAYIIEAFAKLGCDLAPLQTGETVPTVPHQPGREKLLNRLMLVLRDTGLIALSGRNWIRTDKTMPVPSSSIELFDQIQARFPKWAPEHELLHVAGSNLAGHLDGTQNPLKLFFGTPERRKLMADQYLVAPVQSAVSQQLASFIGKCFSSRAPNEPLRVLEIGGGTCGTTVYALDAFSKAGIPVEYTFTDISSSFIAAAKSKLQEYEFVTYSALDVSQVPPAEFRARYDMIIATNVIHATRDAGKSAGNVRQMLREGGFFTMVEYTHAYAAIDVIFGQLDGWWLFDDGRTHATMDEKQWDSTLRRVGYNVVDWTGSESRESKIMRIFLAY